VAGGCSEVRGRRLIQQGNTLYKQGDYPAAVTKFEEAEKYVPDFWILWLNKGYTCRQQIIPGAQTPANKKNAQCALAAFKRLRELKPDDNRGELLYIQTLFDAEEFETLTKMYEERFQKNPKDTDSIQGLISVYNKWKKMDEAMEWYMKKAEVLSTDAEAQYAVGVYIWSQLMQHGGGPDKQVFIADDPKMKGVAPPAAAYGDIVSQQRIDLADRGIEYLQKALVLRPKYHDAMTYTNLLYRQKAYAFFDQPTEWRKWMTASTEWACKSMEAQGRDLPPSCTAAGKAAALAQATSNAAASDAAAEEPAAAAPGKTSKKKAPKKGKRRK
jgi:tetratricopeptide (TPR) repeat protein